MLLATHLANVRCRQVANMPCITFSIYGWKGDTAIYDVKIWLPFQHQVAFSGVRNRLRKANDSIGVDISATCQTGGGFRCRYDSSSENCQRQGRPEHAGRGDRIRAHLAERAKVASDLMASCAEQPLFTYVYGPIPA